MDVLFFCAAMCEYWGTLGFCFFSFLVGGLFFSCRRATVDLGREKIFGGRWLV